MRSDDERLPKEIEAFERELAPALRKMPERKERFETLSGVEIPRVLTPADAAGVPYVEKLGLPGRFPFTRGVQATMYRGRPWTMRQYAGFASAEETNRRFRHLLDQGQTGLSVAFDLPTQIGYDSDHPLAAGEVGKVGVPVSSLADLRTLLAGIPLGEVSISMTINSTAIILLAFTLALAEESGVPPGELRGTVQNDILKEYVARGTFRFPPEPSLRLVTDVIAFATERLPKWNPISISGYHIREAGATAPEEVAFTLADGIEYCQAAIRRGLAFDAFAPRLSFFFNAHSDLLEEVAKFRAARRLWARIARDRFGAKNPQSMMLRFHAQTAGSALTAAQPDVNVCRVTLQALAAVLGGCQSLHTNSRDEALALPTEASTTLALRTQQVIAFESGVADTVDPLGGSYLMEHLTDRIEEEALRILAEVDRRGGARKAIEEGYIQARIQESAFRHQSAVDRGERVIVGVNRFVDPAERPLGGLFTVDPGVEAARRRALDEHRRRRDGAAVESALRGLDRAAATPAENLVPPVVEAARSGATVGEISAVFARAFGEYEDGGAY